jgi:hypothetical protein
MGRRIVLMLVDVEVNVPLLDLPGGLRPLVGRICRLRSLGFALLRSVVVDVRVGAGEKERLSPGV